MNIGIVAVDAVIPNLALMRLSAWHKSQGDTVEVAFPLKAGSYDRVYVSKQFTFTADDTVAWPCEVVRGGTGYDLTTVLTPEQDTIYPDYGMYGCEYAMGRITRGCPRNCPWCVVPKMDGHRVRQVAELDDFWRGQEVVRLLDDNLTADRDLFIATCERLAKERVKVIFEALDVRMMTVDMARSLAKVRRAKRVHFAWDSMEQEAKVREGIAALKAGGFPLYAATFYVLIGFDTSPEEDMYRVKLLDDLGVESFVMPFDKSDAYQKRFARWVNAKPVFGSCKFEEYNPSAKNGRRAWDKVSEGLTGSAFGG